MNEINANCFDTAVHSHDGGRTLCQYGTKFVERCAFEWARPRVTTYRAADPRPLAFRLNRYPGDGSSESPGAAPVGGHESRCVPHNSH